MTTFIVDHLWQSTLFAIVAWLLTLALRNNAARVRYWVWLAASIKFLLPFSLLTALGSQFSWQSSTQGIASSVWIATVQQFATPLAAPAIVLRAPQARAFDFMLIVVSLWIVGCVLLLARWSLSWLRIVSAARNAQPVAMQAPLIVKSSPIMSEPGVVGIVRPVLLLPDGIAARLSAAQMQAILAHELCHVRRRDNLTAAIHMVVEVLFWFHPLVWWIGARMIEERERACDEGVIELGNEPQVYAEGILKVCQFYMESKLTCVAGVSGANLRQRVESIMRNRLIHDLSAIKSALVAIVGVLAVAVPVVLGLLTTASVTAQAVNASQSFDAVSIRLSVPTDSPEKEQRWLFTGVGKLSMKNLPLRDLIVFAYDLHKTQNVGGPAWIDTTKFDIDASKAGIAPGKDSSVLVRQLAQNLLADRFEIRSHHEIRDLSAFVLTVGEQEPEFAKQGDVARPDWMKIDSSITPDRSGITLRSVTMSSFARMLSSLIKLPVIDRTGLAGKYNFRLDKPFDATTLPVVLEKQLGLRLEPKVTALEMVVIDSVQYPRVDLASAAAAVSNAPSAGTSPSVERENLLKQRQVAASR